jgi:hypothetical protein
MIHGNDRQAAPPRPCRGNTCTDKERTDQARTGGHPDRINGIHVRLPCWRAEEFLKKARHPEVMLTGCNFRDHSACGSVEGALTCDALSDDLSPFAHKGNRRLIAT